MQVYATLVGTVSRPSGATCRIVGVVTITERSQWWRAWQEPVLRAITRFRRASSLIARGTGSHSLLFPRRANVYETGAVGARLAGDYPLSQSVARGRLLQRPGQELGFLLRAEAGAQGFRALFRQGFPPRNRVARGLACRADFHAFGERTLAAYQRSF